MNAMNLFASRAALGCITLACEASGASAHSALRLTAALVALAATSPAASQ